MQVSYTNLAKDIICEALGKASEPYEGEWADEPIAVGKNKATASSGGAGIESILTQLNGQIAKAQRQNESQELVSVMKEVRKMLRTMQEGEANET